MATWPMSLFMAVWAKMAQRLCWPVCISMRKSTQAFPLTTNVPCAARILSPVTKGGGFKSSGLAENYLYLFCRNNEEYMPGGGNKAENEILWGLPFDSERLQSYGGTMFLINGALADEGGMSGLNYGCSNVWKSMKAPKEFSEHFSSNDLRWDMWVKGPIKDDKGEVIKDYKITNDDFGQWGRRVCLHQMDRSDPWGKQSRRETQLG